MSLDFDYRKTQRGFAIADFTDEYGEACSIQESSIAGSPCIWLGIDQVQPKVLVPGQGWVDVPIQWSAIEGMSPQQAESESLRTGRMHLTQDMVRRLLPRLWKFAMSGELAGPDPNEIAEVDVIIGYAKEYAEYSDWSEYTAPGEQEEQVNRHDAFTAAYTRLRDSLSTLIVMRNALTIENREISKFNKEARGLLIEEVAEIVAEARPKQGD